MKIRGTASHIAEKYATLARDALASGDVVASESYLQHAEHYNRIIMAFQTQQDDDSGGNANAEQARQNGSGERPAGNQPDIAADGNAPGDNGKEEGVMRTLSRSARKSGNGANDADADGNEGTRPARGKRGSSETPDEAVT